MVSSSLLHNEIQFIFTHADSKFGGPPFLTTVNEDRKERQKEKTKKNQYE